MILDDTTFPIVRVHSDRRVAEGGEDAFDAFERLLALEEPFVLIGFGVEKQEENHDQHKQVALWMKRNRDALHRFVQAMIHVEPQAANRFVARNGAATYEKFWGYPMLVVADEAEAALIAVRLLAGQVASEIVVHEPHLMGR